MDKPAEDFSFVEVILPLMVEGTFTYSIPFGMQNTLQIGQRIVVPFGGKKLYTGIIYSIHNSAPKRYKTKDVISVLEDFSMVNAYQLKLWEWIAKYYINSIGEVYRNAFPTALKLESLTYIKRNLNKEISWDLLDEYETLILQSLENTSLVSLKELESFIPSKKIIAVVKALLDEGWIVLDEKLVQKYKPKLVEYICVNPKIESNPMLFQQGLESLKKAPKQRELLLLIIQKQSQVPKINKTKFLQEIGFSNAILKGLVEKDFVEIFTHKKDRLAEYTKEVEQVARLSAAQEKAYVEIKNNWKTHNVNLLQGVTSSGKTEIYIQLIQEVLEKQKNTLYLLPEIAITTQLIQRLQLKFGNKIAVYHSKLNAQERVELYQKVLQNKIQIIIGARSALFLPFSNLGLVIIDEEHETSFKQQDSRPYFNAKDSAMVLAKMYGAKVLLGSATPSLETLYNCQRDKYKKVELNQRFGNVLPPKIELISLLKEMPYEGEISNSLKQKIQETLDQKKQVILFQNRRGYTPVMECEQCNYSAECINCDVTLTYHKYSGNLKCHYCGFTQNIPKNCPKCESVSFSYKGLGTQKIEEEVLRKFPDNITFRMDSDTMRGKYAYEKLFEKFEAQEIDILIGTQMITKGLDFSNVGLVAVIKADSLLHIPDFRIEEKTYQLLTQVAGRAGRREEQGLVVIQTYDEQHKIFQALLQDKQDLLLKDLLEERKQFNYPPYYKLIEVEFSHTNAERTEKLAYYFTQSLYAFIPKEYVLGPTAPSINKIRNKYFYKSLIKLPLNISQTILNQKLRETKQQCSSLEGFKAVRIKINVNPV